MERKNLEIEGRGYNLSERQKTGQSRHANEGWENAGHSVLCYVQKVKQS